MELIRKGLGVSELELHVGIHIHKLKPWFDLM